MVILSRIDIRDLIKGHSFFGSLDKMNDIVADEKDVDKFCDEFVKECKYKDMNDIPNDLNILFDAIGWRMNINVLRCICCIALLFHRNKAYHDNLEWFGDDIKKQIIIHLSHSFALLLIHCE